MAKGGSRDKIAEKNDIAFGSVSNVINEIGDKDIPDIDLLREVALALKEEGLELIQFARSMRLNKFLGKLGMSEEQIENFLEHLSVFFYKNDVGDIENFLIQLEAVSDMVRGLDLFIYNIQEYITDKRTELDSLIIDIIQIKLRIEQAKSEFISTVKNTEKYREARMYGA
jgi:transcriptional regulator with XRE-family HTH domain